MHGQFVWYELMTPDVDAARTFYPAITGWGTQAFDPQYTMWTSGGVPFAGLMGLGPEERQRGVPPHWLSYVEVRSVDDTARQAVSLGGRALVEPRDIPGAGRFAVLQDPQGAVFGIYRPTMPLQAWDGTPALGHCSWHELMTTDAGKAFDFYKKLFGWKATEQMDMGGGNMYTLFGQQKSYGGIYNRMPEMASIPPFWLLYISVDDVPKAVDAATRGGAKLHRGPMDIPGGRIAILGDPQGAAFALHDTKTSAAAAAPSGARGAKAATRGTNKPAARKTAAKTKTPATAMTAAKKSPARRSAPTKKRAAAKKGASATKRSTAGKSGRNGRRPGRPRGR